MKMTQVNRIFKKKKKLRIVKKKNNMTKTTLDNALAMTWVNDGE